MAFASTLTGASADQPAASAIYDKAIPSVMVLKVATKGGDNVIGTGFMALKDGLAITAWHVVNDAKSVTAKFQSGEEFDVSGLVDSDPKRDLALVRVKAFGRPLLDLFTGAPAVGDKAYVIGAPEGFEFSISDGIVSQIRQVDGMNVYQFSSPISPGNSGGPVIDADGKVIGIVRSTFSEGQNLNFAVPSTYALALDGTLPTKPWTEVTSRAESTEESASGADFDKLFASYIMVTHDVRECLSYVRYEIYNRRHGYAKGVPTFLYTTQKRASSLIEDVSLVATSDQGRERLRKVVIDGCKTYVDALDLVADGIVRAQANDGWEAVSVDATKRCNGLMASVAPPAPEDLKLIEQSNEFETAIATYAEPLTDPEHFELGAGYLSSDMSVMLYVIPGSVADKLGFKSGDHVVSAAGENVGSIHQLAQIMEKGVSKKIVITVLRDGNSKDLKPTIPKDLVAK